MKTIKVFAIPEVAEQTMDGNSIAATGVSSTIDLLGILEKIVLPVKINHGYNDTGKDGSAVSATRRRAEYFISSEHRDVLDEVAKMHSNDEARQSEFKNVVKDLIGYGTWNCQGQDLEPYGNKVSDYQTSVKNSLYAHPRFEHFISKRAGGMPVQLIFAGTDYNDDKTFDLVSFRVTSLFDGGEGKDPDLEIQIFTTQEYFNQVYEEPIWKFYYPNIDFDIKGLEAFDDNGTERFRIADWAPQDPETTLATEMDDIAAFYSERKTWKRKEVTLAKTNSVSRRVYVFYDNIPLPAEYFTTDFVRTNFAEFLRETYAQDAHFKGKGQIYLDEFLMREWPKLFPGEKRQIVPVPYVFPFIKNMDKKAEHDKGKIVEGETYNDHTMVMPYQRFKTIVEDTRFTSLWIHGADSATSSPSEYEPQIELFPHADVDCPLLISPGITDILPQWKGTVVVGGGAIPAGSANLINEFYMIISYLHARAMQRSTFVVPDGVEDLSGSVSGDKDTIVGRYTITGEPTDDESTFNFQGIEYHFRQVELNRLRLGQSEVS
jgi:hypothetical protein